jgi:hypothetical protein
MGIFFRNKSKELEELANFLNFLNTIDEEDVTHLLFYKEFNFECCNSRKETYELISQKWHFFSEGKKSALKIRAQIIKAEKYASKNEIDKLYDQLLLVEYLSDKF